MIYKAIEVMSGVLCAFFVAILGCVGIFLLIFASIIQAVLIVLSETYNMLLGIFAARK